MKKEHKILLGAAVIAVLAYLAIRWYENQKSSQLGNTQGGAAEGTNLNSIAPELVGGSTGPSIGPALSTPITINVTSSEPKSPAANPVAAMASGTVVGPVDAGANGSMLPSAAVSSSALSRANPDNSATGPQDRAPVDDSGMGNTAAATSAATGQTYMTPASSGTAEPNTRNAGRGTTPKPVVRQTPRPTAIKRDGTPRKREPRKRRPEPAKR